jgi:hypothetical protein
MASETEFRISALLSEQIFFRGLMRLMAFTALSLGKWVVQAQSALFTGNVFMAGETEDAFFFLEQIFFFGFMGSMTGQTLARGCRRVLYRTSSKSTGVMARKTQPVPIDNEQRRHLGSMPDMAGQAFPFSRRGMDTGHLLVLPLFMAIQTECFRFLGQHVDKITGMDRVTRRAVSRTDRFMKPYTLVRGCMTFAAEGINVFGHDQITLSGNPVAGLTVPAGHRFMDNCFQEPRSVGTVRCVA